MLKSILILCAGLLAGRFSVRAAENAPGETAIKQILQRRIDTEKKGVGIVVGIIDEKGTNIVSYGRMNGPGSEPVDGDTVFEIGSVSKVLTCLVLADMVRQGEVKLEDPIAKYLPKSVKVPTRKGKEITLADLATHTSGLPRLPDNLEPKDEQNPYADYTVAEMYEFLSGYTLPRDIGAKYEYSNLGVGLLGHILALKAGCSYEELVLRRVCRPLGMTHTQITLSPAAKARFATGHNELGKATANWDIPTLAGAGAWRSTVNDLLKFVAANMTLTNARLAAAMELEQTPRHAAGSATMKIGLAWHIASRYDVELVWHNGGTGGYHSFIGFNKAKQRGVVVLANSENSIDDIGFHLLEPQYDLSKAKAGKTHTPIELEGKVLDGYTGRYQLQPQIFFDVKRAGDHLQVRLTGQGYLDIFPETRTGFFCRAVDAQITFEQDSRGKTTALVLHQLGTDQSAEKIADEPEKERAAIKLDPRKYEAYVGHYQLQPGIFFTVRQKGERLLVQLTGQSFLEVYPESETDFFYKVIDAQLTFVKNSEGEPIKLILHQNGIDQTARKVK